MLHWLFRVSLSTARTKKDFPETLSHLMCVLFVCLAAKCLTWWTRLGWKFWRPAMIWSRWASLPSSQAGITLVITIVLCVESDQITVFTLYRKCWTRLASVSATSPKIQRGTLLCWTDFCCRWVISDWYENKGCQTMTFCHLINHSVA